ncbi:hypothetical protein WAI453_010784 [Rhynchosporium graminicola]
MSPEISDISYLSSQFAHPPKDKVLAKVLSNYLFEPKAPGTSLEMPLESFDRCRARRIEARQFLKQILFSLLMSFFSTEYNWLNVLESVMKDVFLDVFRSNPLESRQDPTSLVASLEDHERNLSKILTEQKLIDPQIKSSRHNDPNKSFGAQVCLTQVRPSRGSPFWHSTFQIASRYLMLVTCIFACVASGLEHSPTFASFRSKEPKAVSRSSSIGGDQSRVPVLAPDDSVLVSVKLLAKYEQISPLEMAVRG